jgi:hypothetical protein
LIHLKVNETRSHWERAPRRRRVLLTITFALEVGLALALMITFGVTRGLVIFLLSMLPIVMFSLALPIWWAIRQKRFDGK